MKVRMAPLHESIFKAIGEKALNRASLCEITCAPRTTLFDNLAFMEREGWVSRYSVPTHQKGRPMVYWYLTPKGLEFFRKYGNGKYFLEV